jgi:hypothetical protein
MSGTEQGAHGGDLAPSVLSMSAGPACRWQLLLSHWLTVLGHHALHRHFTEHLERSVEPSAPPEGPHQRGPRVRLAVEQPSLEDVRVQLRGAAGGGGRRRED